MAKKFFTRKGWLTFYAMACGYQHVTEEKGVHVVLSMNNAGLNTFDVIRTTQGVYSKQWEVVEGINEARALYRKLCNPAKPARRSKKSYEPETMPQTVYA